MKVEPAFEVARSVPDSPGFPPHGVAFGVLVAEEEVGSVVPQARLALECEASNVYMPLLLREKRVSVQAFDHQDFVEALKGARFFVVFVLS